MDYNGFYMVVMISLIEAIFTSLSIALFITFILLKKYNDYGDTTCSMNEYSQFGIDYRHRVDNILPSDKNDFFYVYAENPYAGIDHSIPEQLIKNSKEAQIEREDEF